MEIPAPKHTVDDPEYNFELQQALDHPILELVDRIAEAGWNKQEALKALAEVIRNQAQAYEHDPAPEEESSELVGTDNSAELLDEGIVENLNLGP